MRYCTRCKSLCKDEKEKCPVCGKKTISDPSHFSPVKIITANGFELERIRSALEDANIPYSYNESANDTGLQILNSAPPENCDVFVPLSAYPETIDILAGIGALKDNDIPESSDEIFEKAKKEAKEEELPPQKAELIRILSALAFLAVIAAVVWLTDFIFELIKTAFTH